MDLNLEFARIKESKMYYFYLKRDQILMLSNSTATSGLLSKLLKRFDKLYKVYLVLI